MRKLRFNEFSQARREAYYELKSQGIELPWMDQEDKKLEDFEQKC